MRLNEIFTEDKDSWQKHKNPRAGGMSKKAVRSYRRSHPGSKIQTAVTTKPSKLKKGSKAAKRRKSFCARMRGMKKRNTSAKTARDPNSNINKSLRRWNCESVQDLRQLLENAQAWFEGYYKDQEIKNQERSMGLRAPEPTRTADTFYVVRMKNGQWVDVKDHFTYDQAFRHAQNIKQKYPGMEVGVKSSDGAIKAVGFKE